MNPRKVGIIGCGNVGASIAFSLMPRGLFSYMVLPNIDQACAEGEAMDLSHGSPYAAAMTIETGSYPSLADCLLVIITTGAMQKSGESRLDLIGRNVRTLSQIIGCITQTAFAGILLIVSNPVDILTFEAQRLSGYPASRVLGSGTVLDTSRLKHLTSLPHSSETPSRTLPIPDARVFSASAAKLSLFQ